MTALHIYDGCNVLLRDLEKETHNRLTIRQRYEEACQPGAIHIWCFDGKNHNERRKTIYPNYKSKRTPLAENRYAQMDLFKEAIQHSPAWLVCCDGWEGDDVIAALVKRFSARGDIPITIHSNDGDYQQLLTYPMVYLNGVRHYEGVPAHRIALYKALVGDSSDNIDGIRNFGPKQFEDLKPYWGNIEKAIEDQDLGALLAMPFKPAIKLWLNDSPNIMVLRCALAVTRFLPIPDETLDKGIRQGKLDRSAANAIFKRFFL